MSVNQLRVYLFRLDLTLILIKSFKECLEPIQIMPIPRRKHVFITEIHVEHFPKFQEFLLSEGGHFKADEV